MLNVCRLIHTAQARMISLTLQHPLRLEIVGDNGSPSISRNVFMGSPVLEIEMLLEQ